jgi:hypothetical protein
MIIAKYIVLAIIAVFTIILDITISNFISQTNPFGEFIYFYGAIWEA